MRLVAPEDHITIKMTVFLINLLSNMFIRSADISKNCISFFVYSRMNLFWIYGYLFINTKDEHAVEQ